MTDAPKPLRDQPPPEPPRETERKPLVLSPRMKDVTAKYAGRTFAVIGAPPPKRK